MKRRFIRHRKRLRAEFSSGEFRFQGLATHMSEGGIFIKTQHPFRVNVIVHIKLILPDGKPCFLKGAVRNARRKTVLTRLNGMGIELLEKDGNYIKYIGSLKYRKGERG